MFKTTMKFVCLGLGMAVISAVSCVIMSVYLIDQYGLDDYYGYLTEEDVKESALRYNDTPINGANIEWSTYPLDEQKIPLAMIDFPEASGAEVVTVIEMPYDDDIVVIRKGGEFKAVKLP